MCLIKDNANLLKSTKKSKFFLFKLRNLYLIFFECNIEYTKNGF